MPARYSLRVISAVTPSLLKSRNTCRPSPSSRASVPVRAVTFDFHTAFTSAIRYVPSVVLGLSVGEVPECLLSSPGRRSSCPQPSERRLWGAAKAYARPSAPWWRTSAGSLADRHDAHQHGGGARQ
jgi:hypothetical protein